MIRKISTFTSLRLTLSLSIVAAFAVIALNAEEPKSGASGLKLHVTHILGFEGLAKNANGELFVDGDALRFEKSDKSGAQISLSSIQDVLVGTQDKQVGGTALMLGRAATPYGGGRVIALFTHKKYDVVSLKYQDANGGVHGALFQLPKGEADTLKSRLEARGLHATK